MTTGEPTRVEPANRFGVGVIFLFFLVAGLTLLIQEASRLFLYEEPVGYGDSCVLYEVQRFQNTGQIYRELSQPPYMPVLYSPLVYIVYSLPGRFASWSNPFLGPRLIAMAAFLLCLGVVVSLLRAIIPVRSAWIWGLLLAVSISSFRDWVIQLRGDFFGVFFSLTAVRLLLVRSKWAVVAAGFSAGLATQFKITYLAALAAGALWLLLERRWKDLVGFVGAGVAASVGIYLLFWLREPRMIAHITALGSGMADLPGWFALVYRIASEPVVLLAPLAISATTARQSPRWRLLLLYGSFSFGLAALTEVQSGGNLNYFFEGLFALIPAAVLGVLWLMAWSKRRLGASLCLMLVAGTQFLIPAALGLYSTLESGVSPAAIRSRNRAFLGMVDALKGRHILSTVPRFALINPSPALTDPYLLSQLMRLGRADPSPLLKRVREEEFDLVITSSFAQSWRGTLHIPRELHGAIEASYQPRCLWSRYMVHLPRHRPESAGLREALRQAGCVAFDQDRPGTAPPLPVP